MNKTVKSVALIVCLVAFLISLFSVPMTEAVSVTTTGLVTDNFDSNQGKYAKVGGFNIYAFDNELIFYSDAAVYVKTFAFPITTYAGYAGDRTNYGGINAQIGVYNSTTIYLAYSFFCSDRTIFNYGYKYSTILVVCLINVASLAYSSSVTNINEVVEGSNGESLAAHFQYADVSGVMLNGVLYVAVGSRYIHINYGWIYSIASNAAATERNEYTSTGSPCFIASTFALPTSNNASAYFISRNSFTGSEANIFKFTVSGYTLTSIGSTGATDTYGVYWNYLGGYLEHTLGANTYFDVLVSFGYTSGTEAIRSELIRFNDTSITVPASIASSIADTIGNLRVIGVGSTSLLAANALIDGTYHSIYYNGVGALKYYPYVISDLNTNSPQIGGGGSILSYQGLVFLFGGSTSAGGLIDGFSTIALMVDYSGNRCAAETVTPLSSTLTYTYSWSPTPPYETQTLVQLYGSTNYVYTGHVGINGVNGQGTATLINSNTSTLLVIKNLDAYGNFSFIFSTPSSSVDSFFLFSIQLTNFNGNYAFIMEQLVLGTTGTVTPTPFPFPTYSGGGGAGGGGALDGTTINYNLNIFVNFFLLFICIVAPAIILGVMAGVVGFLGGCVLGLGVGVLAGLLPFWFIFLVGLALVAVLFYGRQPQKSGGAIDG